jgi:hypothetical protein
MRKVIVNEFLWPNASAEEQVIAEPLNSKPKHIASTTLAEPLEWQNSRLLGGGKRIFREDGALRRWRLSDGRVASTGAILATYVPADLKARQAAIG